MRKTCYSLALLLFIAFWGCSTPQIKTTILKPKESDFRSYSILKITDLANAPDVEALITFPDRLAEEIMDKELFKKVERIEKVTRASGDRHTLELKLTVADYDPGTMDKGVWWGGRIAIQCSIIEKITNSEIFRSEISSPLDVYMMRNFERGFVDVSNRIIEETAKLIEQNW